MIPTREIKTEADARTFLSDCIAEIGTGFHPDTPFLDYVNGDGEQVYTPGQAKTLDDMMDAAVEVLLDEVYTVAADMVLEGVVAAKDQQEDWA
jgi:hypothetical protein